MVGGVLEEVHERIRTGGPLPFEAFMRLALYHPESGYYATRVPGSGGVYGTSPSLTPWFGRLVARDSDSYRYLAESIRMHPDQTTLKRMMEEAGFERCEFFNLTAGVVAVHRGYKI